MQATGTRMNGAALVWKGLSLVLGLFFVGSGMTKVLRVASQVDNFEKWGYPGWFVPFTGALEVGAAIILIASLFVNRIATFGALLLTCVMCGAIYTRVVNNESVPSIVMPIVLLVIALVVAWGRSGELASRTI